MVPAAASERRAHTRRKHMKQFQLVATCLFGLEKSLGEELDALGLRRLFTMDGRVLFEGTPADIARANLSLRCAERVLVRLGAFPARSFEELFEGARALQFGDAADVIEVRVGEQDAAYLCAGALCCLRDLVRVRARIDHESLLAEEDEIGVGLKLCGVKSDDVHIALHALYDAFFSVETLFCVIFSRR